jgi:serine/threonine-protein kinase HipA
VAKTQNYSRETREKAVRLVREHAGDYPSEFAAMKAVAARLGIGTAETLRKWVRQAEIDAGVAAGVTTAEAAQVRELKRKVAELEATLRAASDGDLGSDDQSRSMLAGYQPKLLLAQFNGWWYLPRGRAHSTHILKPRLAGRPDGLAREHYGHALAVKLGLAHYRTELIGRGVRQYLVIERYDRDINGEKVMLIHQEDAAQALGLDWVDENAKFQNPDAPHDSHRPSAYRFAELLGSLQGKGHPVADLLRRLTFTVLIGDNDAHAKNLAVLHLPGRSVLADVYDAVPNLFQEGLISCNLALAIDGTFDHRCISAGHLIREGERWNALGVGEAERIVSATLADFAEALDSVVVPSGVPAAVVTQLAWNVERLQTGQEIGERLTRYRRKRGRSRNETQQATV